jgi:arsenate reductase-like glutaredoxin family protein
VAYTGFVSLQIFGTRKSSDTRKAERFFKDRGVGYQFIDLADKGISAGELRAISRAVGQDALIDVAGPLYGKKGLAYIEHDVEEEILKDPLLLRMPVVRDGAKAVIGADSGKLESFLKT